MVSSRDHVFSRQFRCNGQDEDGIYDARHPIVLKGQSRASRVPESINIVNREHVDIPPHN